MSMSGKVVVVTGAAHGIGLACAQRFAKDGAEVVLADRDEDVGQSEVNDIVERGRKAIFVNCDVSQRLDVLNLAAATLEAFGRVDVLVNNAGIGEGIPFLEVEEADYDRILNVNLKGSFLVGQTIARQMVSQAEAGEEPGSIINMSSVNAVFSKPAGVIYSITKAGIQSLTKGMALALAPHRIRVNAIGPGTIDTPMVDLANKGEDYRQEVLSRTPLGRLGKAEEIAAVAAFLASDDASYITGETIFADGGRLPLHYTVDVD
ncbi:MAG: SDR family NAD(P)-dependent oxidoreductase [Hyphomicrobiaceae bacterium]